MAASSTTSWLHTSLLSPTAQQQSAQHALYGADLPIHSSPHLVAPHQQQQPQHTGVVIGHEPRQPCDGYCNPVHCPLNLDFHHTAESQELPDLSRPAGGSCNGNVGAGDDSGGRVSARKIHKADREKLRRDRLNEQFADLAGVLDPDRPKHDKATILGDSVQAVKEIRSEVKRLRTEQATLSEESRELALEKVELREEKATLKNETENLQEQLRQRIRLMLPWMGMDPSAMMMGAAPCAYPMAVPQSVSAPPTSDMGQVGQAQTSAPPLPAYMPLGPTAPPGAYTVHHPALQGYPMYAAANRPGDGSSPYLPYPHYPPPPVATHSHVERPFPQYASPMHPLPGYLMQMQPPPHPAQPTMSGAPPPVPSGYQSFPPPGIPLMAPPPRPQASLPGGGQAKGVGVHPAAAVATTVSSPDLASTLQSQMDQSGALPSVQTTLQLQTPLHPQPQRVSQANRRDDVEGSADGQNGAAASPSLGLRTEGQSASGVANPTVISSLSTGSAGACSPGLAPTSNRESLAAAHSKKDIGNSQQQDSQESHDPTLMPPVA